MDRFTMIQPLWWTAIIKNVNFSSWILWHGYNTVICLQFQNHNLRSVTRSILILEEHEIACQTAEDTWKRRLRNARYKIINVWMKCETVNRRHWCCRKAVTINIVVPYLYDINTCNSAAAIWEWKCMFTSFSLHLKTSHHTNIMYMKYILLEICYFYMLVYI
jgi:hypothetical protein